MWPSHSQEIKQIEEYIVTYPTSHSLKQLENVSQEDLHDEYHEKYWLEVHVATHTIDNSKLT